MIALVVAALIVLDALSLLATELLLGLLLYFGVELFLVVLVVSNKKLLISNKSLLAVIVLFKFIVVTDIF